MAAPTHFAASAALHLALVILAALLTITLAPAVEYPAAPRADPAVTHLVFVAPATASLRGGGGGGDEQPGAIRRAEGVGPDRTTLRVRKPPPIATASPPAIDDVPPLPSVVLDAKPLASGLFDQTGMPLGSMVSATSHGPGSGGGAGGGTGTGAGSGQGPGLGPGSGGGTGGGVYRAGGAVTAPRVIEQVRPKYTGEALRNKVQGTVVLEAVVTADGCATQIRVVRSLDRGGLDEEAIAAVRQWRFEPGRLAGTPVDVQVVIMLDFLLR